MTRPEAITYVFVGPPGCGKGTQSDILARRLRLPKVDVGASLRQRATANDAIGQTLQVAMARGEMIPDRKLEGIITPIFQAALSPSGIIIDGYCRTLAQVKHLEKWVSQRVLPPPLIIYLKIDPQKTAQRIAQRRRQAGRIDDAEVIFTKRVSTYRQLTEPAIASLIKRWPYLQINGDQSIEQVAGDLKNQLAPLWV